MLYFSVFRHFQCPSPLAQISLGGSSCSLWSFVGFEPQAFNHSYGNSNHGNGILPLSIIEFCTLRAKRGGVGGTSC